MRKDDLIRMRHMLEAARDAQTFAAGKNRDDLNENRMLTFALMKAIEVIGEAATKISPESRGHCGEIPWAEIIGMRHRLIHAYVEIDLDILWRTVTDALPPLIRELEKIVGSK